MVTGGHSGSVKLDSTEIFIDSVWRIVAAAKLPTPMTGHRIATLNNRVLLFGKLNLHKIQCFDQVPKAQSSKLTYII